MRHDILGYNCCAMHVIDKTVAIIYYRTTGDGSVELVDPEQKLRTLAKIPGLRNREIDGLAWLRDNNTTDSHEGESLIGASRDGVIFHLDFNGLSQKNEFNVGGGAILDVEAISNRGSSRRLVAAACEDGTIRVLEYNPESSTFVQVSSLSTGGPVLSIAWNEAQQMLVAGVSDGTIRTFRCRNFEQQVWTPKVRITVENYGKRTPTRVWTLLVLDDGTVVSGDSLGHVQFWNGDVGTLLKSCEQNPNHADVLVLCVDKKQKTIFASGLDSRIVCIRKQGDRWISTTAHRPHTHDVKALCIYAKRIVAGKNVDDKEKRRRESGGKCEENFSGKEILVSGGTDTKLCTFIIESFKDTRPRKHFPWPSMSPICLAKQGRVMAMLRNDRVDLYRIQSRKSVSGIFEAEKEVQHAQKTKLVGSIDIKSSFNLMCSSISPKGDMLAVSDGASLMLFSLTFTIENDEEMLVAKKERLPPEAVHPCSSLHFSPDGSILACGTLAGAIAIISLPSSDKSMEVNRSVEVKRIFSEHIQHALPITHLAISHDSQWLVAGSNDHFKGAIHVFTLENNEDKSKSYSHWWPLPRLEAPHSCLNFLGGENVENALVIACSDNSFYLFDVKERSLSEWSQDIGVPSLRKMPREIISIPDYPVRLAFNPAAPSKFLLVSKRIFQCMHLLRRSTTFSTIVLRLSCFAIKYVLFRPSIKFKYMRWYSKTRHY